MAAPNKKKPSKHVLTGPFLSIFRQPRPKAHVVTFVLGEKWRWFWRATKLFAVPGKIHARVGDYIVLLGIDAAINSVRFSAGFRSTEVTPVPPGFRNTLLSVHIFRIDQGTTTGAYEYIAESAAYGTAIGDSAPKIIIYD